MLCPSVFLMKIGEVKIRTTNPSFFASFRRLDLLAVMLFSRYVVSLIML